MKKKEKVQPKKDLIRGAGISLVTKSLIEGTSQLKWFFREVDGIGNGWVAFGDTDTQEYINDANNFTLVDFNVLANIEPAVLNVFYLPPGADLQFCDDESGKYFIDMHTGEEIREVIKHPMQIAFEKNLKFLNQKELPRAFFDSLFIETDQRTTVTVGEADFPSGQIVLADPLVYLGNERYQTVLARKIPIGSYRVDVDVLQSSLAGLRIVAARLKISDRMSVAYELAMPEGHAIDDYGKAGVFSFFGVDAGLGCICDRQVAKHYDEFLQAWHQQHPNQNHYDDYFKALFNESYRQDPTHQREDGDYLCFTLPDSQERLCFFASGLGDGVYSGYWGFDENREICELIIPFMNPEYFY